MKKILGTCLVVAIAAISLVGCGSKEDDGSNVVPQKPPENAPIKPDSPTGAGQSSSSGPSSSPASGSGQLPPPP